MLIRIYQGIESRKTHLEVNGVTLATEGDLCRDTMFRDMGVDLWTPAALQQAQNLIQLRDGAS